jgi:hypothetical protein
MGSNTLLLPFVPSAGATVGPPSADELRRAGIKSLEANNEIPPVFKAATEKLGGGPEPINSLQPSIPLMTVGVGLPALPKKLVAKILANQYVDFAELPPAKGKSRPLPQGLEGQVIVVQAADLVQSRKIIPDLATWLQYFALYVAVLEKDSPQKVQELMAYQTAIAKASQKYKWPSWVVDDQNFRQEAAGNPGQSWAKVDPSIYPQCFTGQAVSSESWCSRCQCLDHTTPNCPYRQRKRSWNSAMGWGRAGQEQPICIKFNKFNGDCKFGKDCKFFHVCSTCREPHPVSSCKAGKQGSGPSGKQP